MRNSINENHSVMFIFQSRENIRSSSSKAKEDELEFKWILQFSDKTKRQNDEQEEESDLKSEWRAEVR